jgi:hypothetical protein
MNKNKRKPTEDSDFLLGRRDVDESSQVIDKNIPQTIKQNLNKNMKIHNEESISFQKNICMTGDEVLKSSLIY